MSSLTRVIKGVAATISHTWWVGEVATAATVSVTATVKRLDGTAIAGSPFTGTLAATSTFTLPAQADLDAFTVDWAGTVGGAPRTERDYIEVCGGFLFELAEARAAPPPLDGTKYPTALLEALRVEVEQEAERITRRALVPRFARVAVAGTGSGRLMAPQGDLRVLRAVTVDGVAWSADQLAQVGLSESGLLYARSGWWPAPYPAGRRNIILEYEHGQDMPPYDIRKAGIVRLRTRAGLTDTTVPYRATSFTVPDGGIYRLATASKERTGVPEVDAAYLGYQQDLGGFA